MDALIFSFSKKQTFQICFRLGCKFEGKDYITPSKFVFVRDVNSRGRATHA